MDWCNSKINGTQLDPHEQYKEMVKFYCNREDMISVVFCNIYSLKHSIKLGSLSSSTHVNGALTNHGNGCMNMLTHGGQGQIIMMTGKQLQILLKLMLILVITQVK